MQKRGQGEQFNWIFILIAGTVLLTFFLIFTFRYIDLQDKKHNLALARTVTQTILELEKTEQGITEDGFSFSSPTTFTYQCVSGATLLTVNNDYTTIIKDQVLFMQEKTTTTAFRAWIKSWEQPYFIMNFLYFEQPGVQHYIIADPSLSTYFDDLHLGDFFPLITLRRGDPLPKPPAKLIRIAFLTPTPPTPQELAAIIRAYPAPAIIYIDPEREEVTFYDHEGRARATQRAYGKAMLAGALFTDQPSHYTCLVNKAIQHFHDITRIYTEKTRLLSTLSQAPSCNYQPLHQALTHASTRNTTRDLSTLFEEHNQRLSGNNCRIVF